MAELEGDLSTWDLVIFAVITMVPIAPMGIYGVIAVAGNGHVPLIYLFGSFAILFTAWSYGQFASRYPSAGSAYAYVGETFQSYSERLGGHLGFISGWTIMLDYLLIPALVLLIASLWLEQATGISRFVWGIGFIVLMTGVNIMGIDMTVNATRILFVFELIIFGAFGVMAIYTILTTPDLNFSLTPFYHAPFSFQAILTGTSIAVLSFLGFDIMTTLAEESSSGQSVRRAAVFVVPIMAFFFVVQTYLGALIHPGSQFQNTGVAFYFIANQAGGNWLQTLTLSGTVAAGLGDTLAAQAGISRILYSMGNEGHMPNILSKLHSKYNTPYISILLIGVLTVIIFFLGSESLLSSLVNFGALTGFGLVNTALAYHFIKIEETPIKSVIPVIGLVLVGFIWYGLAPIAKEVGIAWVVAGIIYLGAISSGFRQRTTMPVEE